MRLRRRMMVAAAMPSPQIFPVFMEHVCNSQTPHDHVILPEVISKEPLGPAVRHGDNQWGDIVKFVHVAMLNAEELGVTKANVEEMKNSPNPEIRRLLGMEGKFGEAAGLT